MVPEKHRKLLVHIRRTAEREKRKRGEEKEGKADVEMRGEEVKLGRRVKVMRGRTRVKRVQLIFVLCRVILMVQRDTTCQGLCTHTQCLHAVLFT